MLLRIRSPDGTFRIQVEPTTSGEEFAQKIVETISSGTPDHASITLSPQPVGGEKVPLTALQGRKVGDMGFNHGDMLFMAYKLQETAPREEEPSIPIPSQDVVSSGGPSAQALTKPLNDLSRVQEDPADAFWRGKDGKIARGRDVTMCRHGAKGMCDYCMPLEPYDATYQATHQIKHLSFHAYLRKLQSSNPTSSSSALPPLTPLNYRVAVPCTSGAHPSWPAGICTKCQPSAITLQSQSFRMVDHVEFASPALIEKFLNAWRRTGKQRWGLLVGRFKPYEKVPMGIRAVVEAIHEVEQEGEVDGLTLGEGVAAEEERVRQVAKWCEGGLQVVGMVFTDLTPQEDDITKIQYKRHAQSFYLSSLETIFAAHQQLAHPTPTRSSPTGAFSSRFATVCLTGSEEGGVDILAFQVTEQAVAMVQADMIEASVDPGTVRVKREEGDRYVPDVFYSYKNEYGIQVKDNAKPCFPVEYLLVNLTHGFPNDPNPLFQNIAFPIENRPGIESQSIEKAIDLLAPVLKTDGAQMDEMQRALAEGVLSDWHLVFFLAQCGMFEEVQAKLIARVAVAHETGDHAALDELVKTDAWKTLVTVARDQASTKSSRPTVSNDGFEEIPAHLLDEINGFSGAGAGDAGNAGSTAASSEKECPHCTYVNAAGTQDCDVCGLPLN
ncbi:nuclear protein localization protein 4 [Naganishia albida]|nr:nuclear protein localization protein 4 [Naganishia albida]